MKAAAGVIVAAFVVAALVGCGGPQTAADCTNRGAGNGYNEAEGIQSVTADAGKAIVACRNGRVYVVR